MVAKLQTYVYHTNQVMFDQYLQEEAHQFHPSETLLGYWWLVAQAALKVTLGYRETMAVEIVAEIAVEIAAEVEVMDWVVAEKRSKSLGMAAGWEGDEVAVQEEADLEGKEVGDSEHSFAGGTSQLRSQDEPGSNVVNRPLYRCELETSSAPLQQGSLSAHHGRMEGSIPQSSCVWR